MPDDAIYTVTEVYPEHVVLDGNHPLAGIALRLHVKVADVREPTEWETHIPGSVQIPRGILEAKADPTSPRHEPALDPGRQVIVYCRSGARAALAGVTLKELGYTDVVNLAGGITAWKEAGLATDDAHADI